MRDDGGEQALRLRHGAIGAAGVAQVTSPTENIAARKDCGHLANEIAVQASIDTIERTRAACKIWAMKMGHAAPSPRREIRLCASCKHFEKAANASHRCFIIDAAGVTHRLDSMPKDVKGWLLQMENGMRASYGDRPLTDGGVFRMSAKGKDRDSCTATNSISISIT